jgi:2-methylcitrate dehydratase PrpD
MNDRVAEAVQTVAEQCSSIEWVDVPAPVRDRTLMLLFDTLSVMIAGAEINEVKAFAAQYTEAGSAPLVGFSRRTSIEASCWINGTSVCALELDEGSKYARGHPAAHSIPAALALGDGHAGSLWLAAVLGGYEVAARFGRATRLGTGVHPHGTWGATGAAAVAARLADLDTNEIASAIDAAAGLVLAPHFESALDGHFVRNLWVGAANIHGIAAARLAAASSAEIHGTASLTLGDLIGQLDETMLTTPFESRYEIMSGYFKRHASCAYTHAPADAVLDLLHASEIEPDAIESVEVETFSIAAVLDRKEWPTRLAAMFSVPFVVATMIREGEFGPSASDRNRRNDHDIARLAHSVRVYASDEFNDRLPERRGARVTVVLRNGTEKSAEVDQPVGDSAHHPMGWDEIRRKSASLIGSDRSLALERAVRELEHGSVDDLTDTVVAV